ncbi:GLPGLI family protein [Chryseobacterium daeguense]|uniref:GLPGLI family protein n=1 Tax=Chryseobacterium daeguense TaxID=412438 RepID=UPI0004873489|nr:GLPGLI family protein [Chryseobacterium daeguense]
MNKILKILICIGLIFNSLVFSQDLSVIYKFKKGGGTIANYQLDIFKDHSVFYSPDYCFKDDSAKSYLALYKKNIKPDIITLLDKADNTNIYTQRPNLLNWKILTENKVIAGYNVQKAEVFYKGEKWIAWFANNIPFQEGAFVFKGLPGLILNIENENYSFELAEINKGKTHCEVKIEDRKEISYDKYENLFKNVSTKSSNLLENISNLNLDLEVDFKSSSEKINAVNILREIL